MARQSVLSNRSKLNTLSKSASRQKKGSYKTLSSRKPAEKKQVEDASHQTKSKPIGGSKNGESRLIAAKKAPKFYPAEDTKSPKLSRKSKTPAVGKLRSTITPGTVLILLAGKNRGKRVVFVKQLPTSGLLLVTGPRKLNGVGLRRVNQAYVIATSTKLDLSSLKVDAKFDDSYFKKAATPKSKGSKEEFFNEKKAASEVTPEQKQARSADQKSIDDAVLAAVKAASKESPNLAKYLASSFALSKGQHPHLMKF